ncbi:MAG: hypothetical protein JWM76_4266, partial [Pseudonocardiales bacterium]|nr:hypothetical protein [Pseudonocardiales bacterium]
MEPDLGSDLVDCFHDRYRLADGHDPTDRRALSDEGLKLQRLVLHPTAGHVGAKVFCYLTRLVIPGELGRRVPD